MKILFSISYSFILKIPSQRVDGDMISVVPRSSDWAKKGVAKYLHYVREAVRILKQARNFDALVICNAGIESFLVSKWRKLFCPRTSIICVDLLIPRRTFLVKCVRSWVKEADAFVCIRKGDIETLGRRFNVPFKKCFFVHFPVDNSVPNIKVTEGDYIYSAGWAHRDWPTLIRALSGLSYHAVLSVGGTLHIPAEMQERIKVVPMKSPEEGRKLMANARLVVLPFKDTDFNSGPLLLLDAMVMGKPVVVTNFNGSRDYVKDGETALLVPPKDSNAMSAAIRTLMDDHNMRKKIGETAKKDVCERFTMVNFITSVIRICRELKKQPSALNNKNRYL